MDKDIGAQYVPEFWFVSRHQGAVDWIKAQGIRLDHIVAHMNCEHDPKPGDVIIGTLPAADIARLNQRGIRFFNLDLTIPQSLRGKDLTATEMAECSPRLAEYNVIPSGVDNALTRLRDRSQKRTVVAVEKCIILTSTFQNTSNLPLILELAETTDYLIILKTPEVTKQTAALQTVLKKHHYQHIHIYDVDYQNGDIPQALDTALAIVQYQQLWVIGNGGPKPASLALEEYLRPLPHKTVYCDRSPFYQTYHGSFQSPEPARYFQSDKLELEDIFLLNDMTMRPGEKKVYQLWPQCTAPADNLAVPYGKDIASTVSKHHIASLRARVDRNLHKKPQPLPVAETFLLCTDFVSRWKREADRLIDTTLTGLNAHLPFAITQIPQADLIYQGIMSKVTKLPDIHLTANNANEVKSWYKVRSKYFHNHFGPSLINLLADHFIQQGTETIATALMENKSALVETILASDNITALVSCYLQEWHYRQENRYSELQKTLPAMAIGTEMEWAVSRDVLALLNEHEALAKDVLNSVWLNVKSYGKEPKSLANAEYDVLLVTRNANLIHLECKSATADLKDLNSRVSTISNSSSNIAQLHVVFPQYTNYQQFEWFKLAHDLREKCDQSKGMSPLPYTLDNQSAEYEMYNRVFKVPAFQDSVLKLLTSLRIR
jgi:CRISPR-associated protein Csx16